jgi:hypothetical protein
MRVKLLGLFILLVFKTYCQVDFPLDKKKFKDIIKYEKALGTKAIFHDERREVGSLKLADIAKYQSKGYIELLPSGVSIDLREVRLQRTTDSFKPLTTIYYYFTPRDSILRRAEFQWNVVNNQKDTYNDNWFDDYVVALGQQRDRFEEYSNQFNEILNFLSNKLGTPKYLDNERVSKKDGTIEFWERKATWDTPKLKVEQKLSFSKKLDENGFGIFEIKLTFDYK